MKKTYLNPANKVILLDTEHLMATSNDPNGDVTITPGVNGGEEGSRTEISTSNLWDQEW